MLTLFIVNIEYPKPQYTNLWTKQHPNCFHTYLHAVSVWQRYAVSQEILKRVLYWRFSDLGQSHKIPTKIFSCLPFGYIDACANQQQLCHCTMLREKWTSTIDTCSILTVQKRYTQGTWTGKSSLSRSRIQLLLLPLCDRLDSWNTMRSHFQTSPLLYAAEKG